MVDLGQHAVGLRALSNGKFLKVVPPKSDEWNGAWRVEVASPLPGLAERFELRANPVRVLRVDWGRPGPARGTVRIRRLEPLTRGRRTRLSRCRPGLPDSEGVVFYFKLSSVT